ncbi:MAG: tetratricopeptide repeat protein [Gammaproteobacteria bacterium]|nr:tetratricopeptide repeat protein [Gammaproteobacteria bacterium]
MPNNPLDVQLGLAIASHQQGRLQEALAGYQQVLHADPGNFTALHCVGILYGQAGRFDEALAAFTQASVVQPRDFAVHFNRAKALQELKRYEEALACYDKVLLLNPGYADAYNNRGNVLRELRRLDEALASYRRAIELNTNFAEAYHNQGNVLLDLRRHEEALVSFNQAIALAPNNAHAYNSRGLVLLEVLERRDDAVHDFRRAVSIDPDYVEAHYNLGNALKEMRCFEEAKAAFDKAIALNPRFTDAYYSRGVLLSEQQKFEEALSSFNQVVSIQPDHARAHYNIGILNLLLGKFTEGWPEYEWRWKTEPLKSHIRQFKQALWLGEQSLVGKTILVHTEQGMGDVIQFSRYLPMLTAMGAKVVLAAPPALASLMQTLPAEVEVVTQWDQLPEFDLHCPILSLPLALKTTLDTIPAHVPYLSADSQKIIKWDERLGVKRMPRVGLVWSGSATHANDRNRSIALRALEPLLRLKIEYHSLQKEVRPEDQLVMAQFPQLQSHADELHDFSDTAALISVLDLVIAVDTSVAHLAGALGKPVWILLPQVPDFRWLLARNNSLWYPTARLFRQQSAGDWGSVIETVKQNLVNDLAVSDCAKN